MVNLIIQKISKLGSLEDSVRDHINTHRYQQELISDLDRWNQICSSLDTFGDTLIAINDYINSDYPEKTGLKYIQTYGVLQAMFIQQDAMSNLAEAFKLSYEISERLKSIRAIRNASIGHPSKNRVKKTVYFNYISRITLEKYGFTLIRSFDKGNDEFVEVNLLELIREQLEEITKTYSLLNEFLIDADKKHREKYMENPLVDIFHSSMSYLFQKVGQGIFSPSNSNRSFGQEMLNSINETYDKFVEELKERNEFNEDIKFSLIEYFHAINKLKNYLKGSANDLTELDARIYLYYLKENHKHFVEIAEEIDKQYLEKSL